jgi:hypothetical protein
MKCHSLSIARNSPSRSRWDNIIPAVIAQAAADNGSANAVDAAHESANINNELAGITPRDSLGSVKLQSAELENAQLGAIRTQADYAP